MRTVLLYCGWARRLAEDVAKDRAVAAPTPPVRQAAVRTLQTPAQTLVQTLVQTTDSIVITRGSTVCFHAIIAAVAVAVTVAAATERARREAAAVAIAAGIIVAITAGAISAEAVAVAIPAVQEIPAVAELY